MHFQRVEGIVGPSTHQNALFWHQVCVILFFFFFSLNFSFGSIFFYIDPSHHPCHPHSTSNSSILRAEITHQNASFWPLSMCISFSFYFFTYFFLAQIFFITKSFMSPMLPMSHLKLPHLKGQNNMSKCAVLALKYIFLFLFFFFLFTQSFLLETRSYIALLLPPTPPHQGPSNVSKCIVLALKYVFLISVCFFLLKFCF